MKAKIIILFCLISLFSNAQKISKINIGIDYWLTYKNHESSLGYVAYAPKVGIFIEKPFLINPSKNIVLSLGVNYKNINESFHSFGLGGPGAAGNLDHQSIGTYLKVIQNTEIKIFKQGFLYYGGFGGINLYTWVTGEQTTWGGYKSNTENSGSSNCTNKSELYNKFFWGFVSGYSFASNAKINPSVELRILPYYGKFKQDILPNPFEIAVKLEIGKKAIKIEEN